MFLVDRADGPADRDDHGQAKEVRPGGLEEAADGNDRCPQHPVEERHREEGDADDGKHVVPGVVLPVLVLPRVVALRKEHLVRRDVRRQLVLLLARLGRRRVAQEPCDGNDEDPEDEHDDAQRDRTQDRSWDHEPVELASLGVLDLAVVLPEEADELVTPAVFWDGGEPLLELADGVGHDAAFLGYAAVTGSDNMNSAYNTTKPLQKQY